MNVFNIPYSGKVVPVPGFQEYKRILLRQTLRLLTAVRWKLFHFKNPANAARKETFGFRTPKPAPPDPDLKKFEELMLELSSRIQTELRAKVAEINNCPDVIVSADKTRNFYRMTPQQYNKLLSDLSLIHI